MELKTSNVAKRLGVSPKTVQRWVKRYNIPCQKNEAGHYVFDAETIALLEQIKFEHGAVLEEFEIEEEKEKDSYVQKHFSPPISNRTLTNSPHACNASNDRWTKKQTKSFRSRFCSTAKKLKNSTLTFVN